MKEPSKEPSKEQMAAMVEEFNHKKFIGMLVKKYSKPALDKDFIKSY